MSDRENDSNVPAPDDPWLRSRNENGGEAFGNTGRADGFTWTWRSRGGRGGGLVLGPLLGIPLLIIMFLVMLVLLVIGGIVFAIGGRRIAAALFRRAASAREFDFFNSRGPGGFRHRPDSDDPDVIDVEAEDISDSRNEI